MSGIRCRHRLPGPEDAGAATKEQLLAWAEAYPHLRPCPRCKGKNGTWNWVYREKCEKCREAEPETKS